MSEFDSIYVPYGGSPLEDASGALEEAISNRQRKSLRGRSASERRGSAYRAQRASGVTVRMFRKVRNQKAFLPELEVWRAPVEYGAAERRSLGNLAMTVFDTKQQPLEACDDHEEAELRERLAIRRPSLFLPTDPIEVTGVDVFGDKNRPFIGLTLALSPVYEDLQVVRGVIAPELTLDDRHQLDHRPHVSLGRVYSADRAQVLMDKLVKVIPEHVQFEAASIEVETSQV